MSFVVLFVTALFVTQKANAQVRTLTTDMFLSNLWDENNKRFTNDKLIVIEFYATWCRPCYTMRPIFESVAREYYYYNFYSVDIDNEPELAKFFELKSIPTIAYIPPRDDGRYLLSMGVIEKWQVIKYMKESINHR